MAAQRWALTLMSNVRCQASSDVLSRSVPPPIPALAKNRSTGSEHLLGLLDQGHVAGLGGDVGGHAVGAGPELGGDGLRALQVGQRDAGTPGVEAAGEGGADAPAGPGDDGMTFLEVHRRDGRRRPGVAA